MSSPGPLGSRRPGREHPGWPSLQSERCGGHRHWGVLEPRGPSEVVGAALASTPPVLSRRPGAQGRRGRSVNAGLGFRADLHSWRSQWGSRGCPVHKPVPPAKVAGLAVSRTQAKQLRRWEGRWVSPASVSWGYCTNDQNWPVKTEIHSLTALEARN